MGEMKQAAKWFKKYADEITTAEYDSSNNPYFGGLQLEVDPEGQKVIRDKLLRQTINDSGLEKISAYPDYQAAVKSIKKAIEGC